MASALCVICFAELIKNSASLNYDCAEILVNLFHSKDIQLQYLLLSRFVYLFSYFPLDIYFPGISWHR